MDPLSTIGLLGDVVQFIDFAAKLLAKSRELYNSSDGHFIETSELIKISEHTSQLSQNLVNRPNSTPSNEFATLIEGCHDVSGELLRALGQLKVQGRKSGYKTFRQAFKTIWSKEKIRELEARLDRFRREINLHICVQLRNDVREFTPRFTAVTTQIDDSSKSIMSAIVAERDVFEAISAFQTDKLQAFVGDKAAAIESSQEHTLHAGIEQVMSTQISISEKSANEQQQRCESILSAIETCTGQTKAQVNGTRIETRQAFGELNKSIRELQTEIAKQREMLQKCLIECASARNTATRAKTVKQSNAIVKAIAGLQDLYQSLLAISGAVNPTPELWQGPLSRQLTIPREASEKAVHRISTWLASIVTTKVTSTQNTFTLPAEVNKAENSLIELVGGISAKFELGRNVEAASVKELSI